MTLEKEQAALAAERVAHKATQEEVARLRALLAARVEVEVASPKARAGRSQRSSPRGDSAKKAVASAAAAAAEEEEEQETEQMEETPDVEPPTTEQTKQLRETLTTLFTSLRAETIEQAKLVTELDEKFPGTFALGQVELILATMADENEVMVVDEHIIKIYTL